MYDISIGTDIYSICIGLLIKVKFIGDSNVLSKPTIQHYFCHKVFDVVEIDKYALMLHVCRE